MVPNNNFVSLTKTKVFYENLLRKCYLWAEWMSTLFYRENVHLLGFINFTFKLISHLECIIVREREGYILLVQAGHRLKSNVAIYCNVSFAYFFLPGLLFFLKLLWKVWFSVIFRSICIKMLMLNKLNAEYCRNFIILLISVEFYLWRGGRLW